MPHGHDNTPAMRRAAGPLLEVAASYFANLNETSDQIDVTEEAVAVYLQLNQREKAVKCMQTFDNRLRRFGQPARFERRIAELQAGNQ